MIDSLLNGFDGGLRRVSRHGAGISEGEINVLMVVDIEEFVSMGFLKVKRESTSPFVHPGHGDLTEEIFG